MMLIGVNLEENKNNIPLLLLGSWKPAKLKPNHNEAELYIM